MAAAGDETSTGGTATGGLHLPIPRLRVGDRSSRVTTFELFFDLVYVFAFTQVSRLMADTQSAVGVLQALVVLALMWWTWVAYGWLSNQAPADQPFLRTGMTVAMIAVFVAALTIPEAYSDLPGGLNGPLVLVVAYALVRILHMVLYTAAAGDDTELRRTLATTLSLALIPAVILLVIGAFIGGAAQVWIWLAAVVYDAVLTRYTSRGGSGWRIHSVAHWTERHGAIVILALGESIVAIGVGVAREPIDTPIIVGSAVSVTISVLLWWSYFAKLSEYGERGLSRLSGAAQVALARDAYTYVHFAIVSGIVLTALGIEQAMAHVETSEPFGWFGAIALGSGIAAFAGGSVWFGMLVGLRRPWMRATEAVVMVAAIPLFAVVPSLAALVCAAVAMLVIAVVESRLHRRTAEAEGDGGREDDAP